MASGRVVWNRALWRSTNWEEVAGELFPLGGLQADREGRVSPAQLDRVGWILEGVLGSQSPFHDGEMAPAVSAWC
jgi:hypothetical protein